ncbi:MAG: NADPH-dependent FMN reductase [Nitrospirae bacterium GWC2_56_14]|nr:MAG: NADPH-dependent FMN reductase [Nitrospirae bacterium GWC2_56_14]
MRIVTILGSPRSKGNSTAIARHFTDAAAGRGAAVETFELNRLSYRGCQGCYACKKTLDRCVLDDDLAPVLAAVKEADLVLMASPVYYGDVTAQLKGFIDRSYSYLKPDYITNPQPSRLEPKKLVFVLTQGHPDQALFADIFPRYDTFMRWMGFVETRLIRACGIGPGTIDAVPEQVLLQAEEAAHDMVPAAGQ